MAGVPERGLGLAWPGWGGKWEPRPWWVMRMQAMGPGGLPPRPAALLSSSSGTFGLPPGPPFFFFFSMENKEVELDQCWSALS